MPVSLIHTQYTTAEWPTHPPNGLFGHRPGGEKSQQIQLHPRFLDEPGGSRMSPGLRWPAAPVAGSARRRGICSFGPGMVQCLVTGYGMGADPVMHCSRLPRQVPAPWGRGLRRVCSLFISFQHPRSPCTSTVTRRSAGSRPRAAWQIKAGLPSCRVVALTAHGYGAAHPGS
jgi:hypothetical protein